MGEEDRADVPREDVLRELALGELMLEDATKANSVDISKATVVNRLYYACFHAAQAALYSRGLDPRSHGGVGTLLGMELVEPGEVSRERGRFFNDVATYRRRVDYGSGDVERDLDELIEGTEAFVRTMRRVADVEED